MEKKQIACHHLQYEIMTDSDIVEYYINHNIHDWNKIPEEYKQYLKSRFCDSLSFKESVWRILYKIEKRPTCQICGNNVFKRQNEIHMYETIWCRICRNARYKLF